MTGISSGLRVQSSAKFQRNNYLMPSNLLSYATRRGRTDTPCMSWSCWWALNVANLGCNGDTRDHVPPYGRWPHWVHDLVSEASDSLSASLGMIHIAGTGCPGLGTFRGEVIGKVGSFITPNRYLFKSRSLHFWLVQAAKGLGPEFSI